MNNDFRVAKRYIPLLSELIKRDLKIKYRRSFLGYLWSLMNPLLMMWILTLVFSYVFRFDIANYPLYLITGQIVFNFFSESTTIAMSSIINNAALLKKVYLPKVVFPLASIASSFVNMLFSLTAIFIVMLATDVRFSSTLIILPIGLLLLFVFSVGVGLVVSALAVYFRDLFHLYSVLLTALSFATPIFYPVNIIPEDLQYILEYNPLYYMVNFFRQIIFYDTVPSKIKKVFGWQPRWHIEKAIEMTVAWMKVYLEHGNVCQEMDREIGDFLGGAI